jgi:predicted transcriptional regulator
MSSYSYMVLLPYKCIAKPKQHLTALQLRKDGTSIADIAKQLKVSKSTVSYWCRDLTLSQVAIQKIIKRSASKSTLAILTYTETLRLARQEREAEDTIRGKQKINNLTERDLYCIGLGLYWGEGYKQGSQEFGFTNSNPAIISFYIKWLTSVFNVGVADLILRVSINALHQYRIDAVHKFWIEHTGVPISQFSAPSLIKTTTKRLYANHESHYGTLRVKVRRGTRMRGEVLGALERIAELADPHQASN